MTRSMTEGPKPWIPIILAVGCSFQNLDGLSRGSGASSGGTSGSTSTAATGSIGGLETNARAGAGNAALAEGGTNGAGVAGVGPGAAGVSGLAGTAGSGVAGSSSGVAGSHALGGAGGGTSTLTECPAYLGSGGALITPPSDDFEVNRNDWSTLSGTAGVSRVEGDGTACSGTSYLRCSGVFRQGGWDGPLFAIFPYLTVGHSYAMTLVARFSKATAPSVARSIGFTLMTVCDANSPVYTPFRKALATSNWVRLQSDSPLQVPPAGCKTLVHAAAYVETDDADVALSLEVDDFRLIDKTDPAIAGSGGAGGAGAISTAGNAGMAGTGT